VVRLGTLAATAIAFVMAVSVGDAFEGDGGGLWFIVPYILVRILGLALYAKVASAREGQLDAVRGFALLSTFGLSAALIGGFVDPDARVWWWLGACALDMLAAGIAGRFETWHLHTEHFAERHGLIVIIALGESLIVAAAAVAGAERTSDLAVVAFGALAVTCLLWWTYFGWFKDALEARLDALTGASQSLFARDAYSFLHLPLVVGIIGVAVGFEEMVHHPGADLDPEVLGALVVGIALFLFASVAAWVRAYRRLLWARLIVPLLLAAVLSLVSELAAGWILTITAGALILVIAIEAYRQPGARASP
jgi:low temperature requirement protein LtrA